MDSCLNVGEREKLLKDLKYTAHVNLDSDFAEKPVDFSRFLEIFAELLNQGYIHRIWAFLKYNGINTKLNISVKLPPLPQKNTNMSLTPQTLLDLTRIYLKFSGSSRQSPGESPGILGQNLRENSENIPGSPIVGRRLGDKDVASILFSCEGEGLFEEFGFEKKGVGLGLGNWLARWAIMGLCRPNLTTRYLLSLPLSSSSSPILPEKRSAYEKAPMVTRGLFLGLGEEGENEIQRLLNAWGNAGCKFKAENGKSVIVGVFDSAGDKVEAIRETDERPASKTDSRYYFFKSTPAKLAKQYAPTPIPADGTIPKETPRLALDPPPPPP
mmetsp:Transcript_27909/g.44437  ORF Transcript_27909/g.44437 Transcript_27909/m.44437 type:complete len:327 (-) Transcript_27909:16-996(-)